MMSPLRLQQKLLDGRYRWGLVSRRTGRYGGKSIRLVIYPPNTTPVERRCARLVRFWPGISIGLIALKAPTLAALTNKPMIIIVATTILLAISIGIALTRISTPVTAHSVELFASVSVLSPKETDRDRYDYAAQIAENLHDAEQYLDHGHIPWSKYRTLWAENYWNFHRTV